MDLSGIVRNAVSLADSLTESLQAEVMHSAWIEADAYGEPVFAAAVGRLAIVEERVRERQLSSGRVIMSRAKVTFLRPVPPNGAAGRVEPVDTRDLIVLPSGNSWPIIDVAGLVDPTTDLPYFGEILLGDGGSGQ